MNPTDNYENLEFLIHGDLPPRFSFGVGLKFRSKQVHIAKK